TFKPSLPGPARPEHRDAIVSAFPFECRSSLLVLHATRLDNVAPNVGSNNRLFSRERRFLWVIFTLTFRINVAVRQKPLARELNPKPCLIEIAVTLTGI